MIRLRRLLYEALIVPGAHTRVFYADFQLEVYEVFHTRRATRWMHLVCTLIVNVCLLAAATALPLPMIRVAGLRLDGTVLTAVIALAGYVVVHGAWAAMMIPVLLVAVGLAHSLASALGAWVVPGGLEIAFAAALLQTFSHAFEPVPPPWSGGYRWISLREFLLRTPPLRLVLLTSVALVVFPVLEFWASPRIWPVQIVHFMMRAGLRPALASRTRSRVRAILADARNGWNLPPVGAESDSP
jgi:hypothetical protein